MKKKVVFVDIDMTVADNTHRLKRSITDKGVIDRNIFEDPENILLDKVIEGAVKAITRVRVEYRVVYLSSRKLTFLPVTKQWLRSNDLIKPIDKLILAGSSKAKFPIMKNYLDDIYLVIDDFKYDYQSGNPKLSDYLLPHMRKLNIPLVVFNNNWPEIINNYF